MGNAVLNRHLAERAQQVDFIDELLNRVEAEGRDMVEAERKNLEGTRQRIAELDEQIKPLEEFENLRGAHSAAAGQVLAPKGRDAGGRKEPRPVGGPTAAARGIGGCGYTSAGEFIVDYIRAVGYPAPGIGLKPDQNAARRVMEATGRDIREDRAIDQLTTADIPGLLPKPIVGEILTDLDASRPFVQSIGVRPLTQPGKTFSRPVITTHTQVGEQAAEKTDLASRALEVGGVDFTKKTFGGAVNVSRQAIDWSDPSAWDALLTDLQNVYGADTDDAAAAAFAASVTQTVPVADESIDALIDALYAAAAMIVADPTMEGRASALRLPDKIWTSVDMWAKIGAALSKARLALLQNPGNSSVTSFDGDLLSVPRIMVPGFPAGTVIIGRSNRTEFYEERIGLLSAVEPRIFGVEVAYGGYAAYGTLDPTAFAKLEAPVAP